MSKLCKACTVFQSDCDCPLGDGSIRLCWLCAHYVTHHNMSIGYIPATLKCGCAKEIVYPAHVLEARAQRRAQNQASGDYAPAVTLTAVKRMYADGSAAPKSKYETRLQRATRADRGDRTAALKLTR